VNLREFEGGQFKDLIFENTGESGSPTSNFKSVYLETMSVSDLIRSNSHSIGRPNVVSESAGEVIRESSITYSDPTDPSSKKPKFSSFNLSNINFKDLPETYGNVGYLANFGEFLVALQDNKVSLIPLNRNVLSDASGGQNIIASKQILGSAIFMSDENGCDSPSSVVEIDSKIYFASTGSYSVSRIEKSRRGVLTISDKSVTSLIRDEIISKESEAGKVVRLVGGYDPEKEEYLITIISLAPQATTGAQLALQSGVTVQPSGPDAASLLVTDSNADGIITGADLLALNLINEQDLIDAGFAVATSGEIIIEADLSVSDLITANIITLQEIIDSGLLDASDFVDPALIATPPDIIVSDVNDDNQVTLLDYVASNDLPFSTEAIAYMEGLDNKFAILVQLFNGLDINLEEFINAIDPEFIAGVAGSGDGANLDSATQSQLAEALKQKIEEQGGDDSNAGLMTVSNLQNIIEELISLGADSNQLIQSIKTDIDSSGQINTGDLLLFLSAYGNNIGDVIDTDSKFEDD